MLSDNDYLKQTLELAYKNVEQGGRPFAALIVQDAQIVATAVNEIHLTQDPTAHAELLAIRRATQILQTQDLQDCVIYASGQPCPMCLALIHMTGIKNVIYAYSNLTAKPYYLSTEDVYEQMSLPFSEQNIRIINLPVRLENQQDLYKVWSEKQIK